MHGLKLCAWLGKKGEFHLLTSILETSWSLPDYYETRLEISGLYIITIVISLLHFMRLEMLDTLTFLKIFKKENASFLLGFLRLSCSHSISYVGKCCYIELKNNSLVWNDYETVHETTEAYRDQEKNCRIDPWENKGFHNISAKKSHQHIKMQWIEIIQYIDLRNKISTA